MANGWNNVVSNQNNESKAEVEYVKLQEGDNIIRVLNAEPISVFTHWCQTANGGKGLSIVCIGKKQGCPLCEKIAYDKANNIITKDRISRQHLISVWNYATQSVQILQKGNKIFEGLYAIMMDYGDLTKLDVNIKQNGKGFGNVSYTVLPVPPAKQQNPPVSAVMLDCKEYAKALSIDEINLLMAGMTFEEMKNTLNPENNTNNNVEVSEEIKEEGFKVDFTAS